MEDREELLKAFETLQVSVGALKAEKAEIQRELDIIKGAEKNDEIRRVSEPTTNDTICDSENPTDSKVEQSHLKMDHEAVKAEKDEEIKKSVTEYSDLKNNLISKIVKAGCGWDNYNISPVVRQTLQHWGYQLTEEDFNKNAKRFKK